MIHPTDNEPTYVPSILSSEPDSLPAELSVGDALNVGVYHLKTSIAGELGQPVGVNPYRTQLALEHLRYAVTAALVPDSEATPQERSDALRYFAIAGQLYLPHSSDQSGRVLERTASRLERHELAVGAYEVVSGVRDGAELVERR